MYGAIQRGGQGSLISRLTLPACAVLEGQSISPSPVPQPPLQSVCLPPSDISFLYDATEEHRGNVQVTLRAYFTVEAPVVAVDPLLLKVQCPLSIPLSVPQGEAAQTVVPEEYHIHKRAGILGIEFHEESVVYGTSHTH